MQDRNRLLACSLPIARWSSPVPEQPSLAPTQPPLRQHTLAEEGQTFIS